MYQPAPDSNFTPNCSVGTLPMFKRFSLKSVYLYDGIVSAVFYRNDVSGFDIEAGQVVVVAVIFKGSNLQSC